MQTISQYICLMSLYTDKLKPYTQSRVNYPALDFSESLPTWRLESEKHETLWKRISLKLYSASNQILHQGGSCCSDHKQILHFFNPSAVLNRAKGVTQKQIYSLHVETAEPGTGDDHILLLLYLSWYLFDHQREKESSGRKGEFEKTVRLYVLPGEVDTKTGQHWLRPYGCYSLHPLFSKTKYFFKWLWTHRLRTHTLFLFLTVLCDWCVFLGSGFATRHLDWSLTMTGKCVSTRHHKNSYILSFKRCKSCTSSTNWVWNQLSILFFFLN